MVVVVRRTKTNTMVKSRRMRVHNTGFEKEKSMTTLVDIEVAYISHTKKVRTFYRLANILFVRRFSPSSQREKD